MNAPIHIEQLKHHRGIWTDERSALLTQLWAEGFSASRAALRLSRVCGTPITRNMIIGKVHRLKLPTRNTLTRTPDMRGTPEMNAYRREQRALARSLSLPPINGKARHMLPRLWKARHAAPAARPEGKPVPITEATGCRYIEGNDRLCCNAPGFPWCSYHAAIVWGPL